MLSIRAILIAWAAHRTMPVSVHGVCTEGVFASTIYCGPAPRWASYRGISPHIRAHSPYAIAAAVSSMQNILHPVIRADQRQHPCAARMARYRRPLQRAPRIGLVGTVHHVGHDAPHMRRHLHTVPAVAHRVVKALVPSRARKPVHGDVDETAPAVVDSRRGQFGEILC